MKKWLALSVIGFILNLFLVIRNGISINYSINAILFIVTGYAFYLADKRK